MNYKVSGESSEFVRNTDIEIENVLSLLCKNGFVDDKSRIIINVEPYGSCLLTKIAVESSIGLMENKTVHEDFLTGLELCVKKLNDIIRRQKTRISRLYDFDKNKTRIDGFLSDEVVEDSVQLHQMSMDEAILSLELRSLPFYAYLDNATGKVNIVHKNGRRYINAKTQ